MQAFTPSIGNNASSPTPGYSGGVPNELPDQGPISAATMKRAGTMYGLNTLRTGNPLTAIPATAVQMAFGGLVKGAYKGVKNMLGFGPEKDAPASGLPAHGPQQGLTAPTYDTKDYNWSGAGLDSDKTRGPQQGMNPSESFNTKDFDWDKGWFDSGSGVDENTSDSSSAGPSGGGYG